MKSYLFPKKEGHKGELYLKYEDLAKRAYLGGLNAAYNIGTYDDGVYLDMDFSSAYPTVMNMLNAPDFGEIPPSPFPDSDVIDMSDLEVPL
jgi:DNA polymerase elongation subunit (family B)